MSGLTRQADLAGIAKDEEFVSTGMDSYMNILQEVHAKAVSYPNSCNSN